MKEERALPFEVRIEGEEGQPLKVIGNGAVYNKRSQDLGGFVEIIREGAFRDTLEDDHEIKAFYNHDPNQVLGTTSSEPPLKIRDGKGGLNYEVEIPDTSYGRDLVENLKRKNVRGSSFAFRTLEDNWYKDDKGETVRELLSVELLELGPVTNPAYIPTAAQLRNLEEQRDEFNEFIEAVDKMADIKAESRKRKAKLLRV